MITVFYILVNYSFNSSFKQNHITTVIYWNMLDSCVKTGRTIEYLEYFMLSCSTLRFLLRNSDVPQSCNAPSEQEGMSSFLSRVNVRDRVTEAPRQASTQESYNRKSVYLTLELSGLATVPSPGSTEEGQMLTRAQSHFFPSHTISWSPELWVRLFLCCSSKHI